MGNFKLNKKGFTLIELLAVIVVLAIIIVIAVPSVLSIQKNAKQNTAKDEALLLIKSIDLCMASRQKVSECGPKDLGDYYEKAGKGDIPASYSKAENEFTYSISGTAEGYTLTGFKYTSNGYEVSTVSSSTAYSTLDLKTMIQGNSASISIQ